MAVGGTGISTPTSDIKDPIRQQFNAAGETDIITPLDSSANNMAIAALPSNNGIIYVGNENVEIANGFPLEAGDALALNHDPSGDSFYGVADTAGDQVRVILLE